MSLSDSSLDTNRFEMPKSSRFLRRALALEVLRVPVMPFAIGLYLPIYLSCGIMVGGVVRLFLDKKKEAEAKKKEEARKQAEKHAAQASSKYDQDARVRTGAYRIIGVSEVVTAREGQTIKSLSQKYLGPGMECYVEALNGTSLLKPGQKVKIPKLELKKKK